MARQVLVRRAVEPLVRLAPLSFRAAIPLQTLRKAGAAGVFVAGEAEQQATKHGFFL